MKTPPDYFDEIRNDRIEWWKKNDPSNPDVDKSLINSFINLFKTVKRPEYVISELLQNADDAEANSVSINIEKKGYTNRFIFGHNGKDFKKEEFKSLCNFSVSSKSNKLTTGYRGIGFKSTFSLNKTIYLISPTLSVKFDESKFTLPEWTDILLPNDPDVDKKTYVIIPLAGVKEDLLTTIKKWKTSINSILFFKHVRHIEIEGKIFEAVSDGAGPVNNTEWIINNYGTKKVRFLKITSKDLPIPEAALAEICEERKTSVEDYQNAVISIELVLGDTKKDNLIYATLPTEETTSLPVSINAPFVLNPERNKLKSYSETDPTNSWIFENIGKILVNTLQSWLNNKNLKLAERAEAYRLLPVKRTSQSTFDNIALKEIQAFVANKPIALDCEGNLRSKCYSIPNEIYNLWDTKTLRKFYLLENDEFILSQEANVYSDVLEVWDLVDSINPEYTVECFTQAKVPVPNNLYNLLDAVKYVLGIVPGDMQSTLKIFKTEKIDGLYALNEILLPYENLDSLPEEYKKLIKRNVIFADKDWVSMLSSADDKVIKAFCRTCLQNKETTDDEGLIQYLSDHCSSDEDLILVAHLAAYLSTKVPKSFQYITQDNTRHFASDSILYDPEKILSALISQKEASSSLLFLNEKYHQKNDITWENWVLSDKSRILRPFEIEYSHNDYIFKGDLIEKLEDICERNNRYEAKIWADVLDFLIKNQNDLTEKLYRGNANKAKWIQTLSEKPCIYGDDNKTHIPSEIYYKTEVTELLSDEIFLNSRYPNGFKELFVALGVQFEPRTPHGLLNKLIRYSKERFNDLKQISKDFSTLDVIIAHVDKEAEKEIVSYFTKNPLLFTSTGEWKDKDIVYSKRTELPNTYQLHPSLVNLSLWRRISIKPEPTKTDIYAYLKTLQINTKIPEKQSKFILSFMKENPVDLYHSLKRWINLEYEWKDVRDFEYYLSDESLIPNIVPEWKRRIPKFSIITEKNKHSALLQGVSLEDLFDIISWKPTKIEWKDAEKTTEDWMQILGNTLLDRVPKSNKYYYDAVDLGNQLINTKIFKVNSLQIVPYIDEKPIGDEIDEALFWDNQEIYYLKTLNKSNKIVSLTRNISNNYGVVIENSELKELLMISVDRDEETIIGFCTEQLNLASSHNPVDTDDNDDEVIEDFEEQLDTSIDDSDNKSTSPDDSNVLRICNTDRTKQKKSDVRVTIEDSIKKQSTHPQSQEDDSDDDDNSFSGISNVDKRSEKLRKENDFYLCPGDITENDDSHGGDSSKSDSHSSWSESRPSGSESSSSSSDSHSSGHGSYSSESRSSSSSSSSKPPSSDNGSYSSSFGPSTSGSYSSYSDSNSDPEKNRRHEKERSFLYQEYAGACQICGRKGFKLAREHIFQHPVYFKAINLIKTGDLDKTYRLTEGTDAWNTLSLCPDCAAKYRYGVKDISSIEEQIDAVDRNQIGNNPIVIHIRLDDKPSTIIYSPKHFLALKETLAQLKRYQNKSKE